MIDFFENLPPYLQALVAGIIIWLPQRLGVASVFIFKSVNKRILTSMQGFGIMIADFWSLLQPSIEYGKDGSLPAWLPVAIGFCLVVSSYVSSIQLFLIYIKELAIRVSTARVLRLL